MTKLRKRMVNDMTVRGLPGHYDHPMTRHGVANIYDRAKEKAGIDQPGEIQPWAGRGNSSRSRGDGQIYRASLGPPRPSPGRVCRN